MAIPSSRIKLGTAHNASVKASSLSLWQIAPSVPEMCYRSPASNLLCIKVLELSIVSRSNLDIINWQGQSSFWLTWGHSGTFQIQQKIPVCPRPTEPLFKLLKLGVTVVNKKGSFQHMSKLCAGPLKACSQPLQFGHVELKLLYECCPEGLWNSD